jgi:tetratricopeptide (TPR) repeat protein
MAKVILRAGRVCVRIVLPLVILSLVLYVIRAISMGQVDQPIVPDIKSLQESASTYERDGMYAEAEQAYLSIIAQVPGSQEAFGAQRSLVSLHVMQQDEPAAMLAMEKLLEDYADQERLPHAVHEIVEGSLASGDCQAVRSICQGLRDGMLQSTGGVWLQMGVALSSSCLGDDEALDVAIVYLARDFYNDPGCVEAFGQIAWSLRKQHRYSLARNLYQYVVDTWPDGDRAVFSQRGLVFINLTLHDKAAAWQAVEGLLANFSQSHHLAECVDSIARKYADMKMYREARELYSYSVENFPDDALWSQVGLVITDIGLGDDPNAIYGTQRLVADYEGDSRLGKALRSIGDGFKDAGNLREACDVYSYQIDNFPDSRDAFLSKVNLAICRIDLGDKQIADDTVSELLIDHVNDDRIGKVLCRLVNHYCRRGDDIAARSICRYFLDQRSNPDLEIWARVAQIYTDEDLADPNAIERLFADFAHDSQLAEAAFYTPERFYDRALDLERTGRGGQAQGYFVRAARDWEHVAVRLPQTSS